MARVSTRKTAGFTLVEVLVAVAVLTIIAAISYPALEQLIVRSKVEAAARQTGMLLQQAKLEAVKRSVPTIVLIDPVNREVFAFADVDGAAAGDPPDRVFNPVAGQPLHGTDYQIGGTLALPRWVEFGGPPGDPAAVDRFTLVGGARMAIFRSDGSIEDEGAFRFRDGREPPNFLEVRVAPRATARVELKKWDGTTWHAAGEGGKPWHWN